MSATLGGYCLCARPCARHALCLSPLIPPIFPVRKLRPREVNKLPTAAWEGGHGGGRICTQYSGSRSCPLSSSARRLVQGPQRAYGTFLRSFGAREAVQTFWSPPSPTLSSCLALSWGELVLRIPMQGSSGSKRLQAAGVLENQEPWGSGLPSAQLCTSSSGCAALQGPSSPARAGALAARWHCRPSRAAAAGRIPSPDDMPPLLLPRSRTARCGLRHCPACRPVCPGQPTATLSSPGQAAVSGKKTKTKNREPQLKSRGPVPGAEFSVVGPLPLSPAPSVLQAGAGFSSWRSSERSAGCGSLGIRGRGSKC